MLTRRLGGVFEVVEVHVEEVADEPHRAETLGELIRILLPAPEERMNLEVESVGPVLLIVLRPNELDERKSPVVDVPGEHREVALDVITG